MSVPGLICILLRGAFAARKSAFSVVLAVQIFNVADAANAILGPAASRTNCSVIPRIPQVPKGAIVYRGGPAQDDGSAMQAALDALKPGDWLVIPSGTYRTAKTLTIRTSGITFYGQGAIIQSTSPTQGGLMIQADNVSVYGFQFDQASVGRQSTPWAGGIAVYYEHDGVVARVRGTVIQNNVINNAAAAGIFLYKADGFTIAGNTIWRSWADAIHMTAGSSNGRVIGNTVSQSGDDMIAVVSYAGDPKVPSAKQRYQDWPKVLEGLSTNIYIAGNRVSDEYWGRGISVVGGSDITIEKNTVSLIPSYAGIYIERESSYRTFGDSDVLVRGNVIAEIQTKTPGYNPANRAVDPSGHGAVEIGSLQDDDELSDERYHTAFGIRNVSIIDNTIKHARFSGIRAGVGSPATVSGILVRGNRISDVGFDGITEVHEGLRTADFACAGNKLNGKDWSGQCAMPDVAKVPVASGAALRCSASGVLSRAPNSAQ